MLRAGIVGLGRWGQTLVASVQSKSQEIRFGAAVTRSPAKARDFAAKHQIPFRDDYAALLADQGIDAVVLATPHSQHAEQVAAAARAGKHVLVEKPFTLTKASAEAAVAAAARAGIVLAFAHNRRFLPPIAELKSLIAGGKLGTILHAEGQMSGPGALGYRAEIWRASRAESPAGGMGGMGIHAVDALIGLAGEIETVHAQSWRRVLPVDIDDTTAMLFRFRSGASGALVTLAATAPVWRIAVYGSAGWAELRGEQTLAVTPLEGTPETRSFPLVDKERLELEAFAATVAGRCPYPVSAEEAIHGVAVFEAIVRSAASGETVRVA
jgi:predicted dehydrogenase